MKNKYFSVILILFLSILPIDGEIDKGMKKLRVSTRKVSEVDVTERRDFSEIVRSNRELKIKSPVGGIISVTHVIEGEWVTKGEKIITFSRDEIKKKIEKNKNDIEKWKKILKQRENWKVREKIAEENAKLNIEKYRTELSENRSFLKDPVVRTVGEGKILRIAAKGGKVTPGDILAVIVDDYVMKIATPSGYSEYFFRGMRLNIIFKGKNITAPGRVGTDGEGMTIFVNNPDLKITSGMRADFSATKKTKDIIMIEEEDFRKENGRFFVYISDGKRAVKRYIELEGFRGDSYRVITGLLKGDRIVSPIPDIDVPEFLTVSKRMVSKTGAKGRKAGIKHAKIKKESFSLRGKKIEYVISPGFSISKPENLITRNMGIEASLKQYTDIFGLTQSTTGEFKENLSGIPVNIMVNYKLSDGLYLKLGGEYSMMNNSSSRTYSVAWPGLMETFDYSIKNRITNLMPFVGIEKRFSSFGIYGILGISLTSFRHTSTLNMDDGSYNMKSIEEFKVNGSGIGINIGAKYMIKIKGKYGLFLRLEYVLQKIGSFSGDKTTTVTDSLGSSFSGTESGGVYLYEIDPYGEGLIEWWDLHNASPTGSNIKNVSDFSIGLSRLRFLIGFSF